MLFHIRAPMPRNKGGNAFYKPTDPRVRKTLCGAPITDHDIRYSWQSDGAGVYEPCQECIRIRKEAGKNRKA
jgi:hypothetical protein